MSSPEPTPTNDSVMPWGERFLLAFVFGAIPCFIVTFFSDLAFMDALWFSTIIGVIWGLLAALFGKRMLDFLTSIPW